MEGKELTPVMSTYSNKTEPSCMFKFFCLKKKKEIFLILNFNSNLICQLDVLDKNGINFIKRCTSLLEDDS